MVLPSPSSKAIVPRLACLDWRPPSGPTSEASSSLRLPSVAQCKVPTSSKGLTLEWLQVSAERHSSFVRHFGHFRLLKSYSD